MTHGTFHASLRPIPPANLRAKRVLDLVLVVILLPVFGPLLLVLAAGYWISNLIFPEDRGRIFHKVYRHSAGRAIPVYKFRLSQESFLREKARELTRHRIDWLGRYLPDQDRRLIIESKELLVEDLGGPQTKFGSFLKKFYLDEVPQVFNILQGHISFVGGRPFPLDDARVRPDSSGFVTLGDKKLDYRCRDLLPGGLTGLYQLNKSDRTRKRYRTFTQEGVTLDRKYYELLRSINPPGVIFLDLSIILRTGRVVAEHEGV